MLILKPTEIRCFGCLGCLCACLFDMYETKLLMLSVIKLGCMCCRCTMSENILTFGLSPLYLACMELLLLSVIKLGCKRFVGWKR